jgi:leucyl-tRNA synthetase
MPAKASTWRCFVFKNQHHDDGFALHPTCEPSQVMRALSLQRGGWRRVLGPPPLRRWNSQQAPSLTGLTAKWQSLWDSTATKPKKQHHDCNEGSFGSSPNGTPKTAYILPMFPYPSGTLHLGHLRVYTISDVLARFTRMQGYDVLHPIGWDAFGLPAENAAMERGVHPAAWTLQNIEAMKAQMKEMGGHWSWDKELRTCDPAFYKHTQRLFLMLYERGLAYQAESLVNWDPVDLTVLANEQVDANGNSWRSGAKVEQKMLKQWFLNIKEFQEPLLKDLDALAEDGRWPERVLAMQRNWIGRSVGTELSFDVGTTLDGESFPAVQVFTTRADTLPAVAYVALSMKHPIVQSSATRDKSLQDFLDRAADLPPDTKEGYLLTHIYAFNPLAGEVKDKYLADPLPVYVAPYVLDDYGSGAVMGVPAHDARDSAFWRQNTVHNTARLAVSAEPFPGPSPSAPSVLEKPMLEKGLLVSPDESLHGLTSDQAIEEIIKRLEAAGKYVKSTEKWRLRDWLVSRQRYWGTPIPIVHCSSCGPVPVPENQLPVELPDLPASYFQDRTGNPLAEDTTWKKTKCPKCKQPAERETDTMDTFMDSSWYFFRFLDPQNSLELFSVASSVKAMPVDVYVGGVEHAILHLLYARFISKFLATTNLWPNGSKVNGEPFKRLITQGMVHGKTYSDPATGRFLRPDEVDRSKPSMPLIKHTDIAPKVSYEKMSKSKYNGVDPGATIAKYGADATRAHMLFQAPVSDVLEWDETKIVGVQRWLGRVLRLSGANWFPEHEAERMKNLKLPQNLDTQVLSVLRELRLHNHLKSAPQLPNRPSPFKTEGRELIAALHSSEAELLSKTHKTIASVTQSYSETYSLNTVISDLMTLTNTIWDTPHASICTSWFKWYATVHLLRMLAPVAPGVAEEGWQTLHTTMNSKLPMGHYPHLKNHPLAAYVPGTTGPSIFTFGFPVADPTVLPLLNPTMPCVVQFDGKRKFQAQIRPIPETLSDTDVDGVRLYLFGQLLKTNSGRKYLGTLAQETWSTEWPLTPEQFVEALPRDWAIRVAKRGAIVNVSSPKKKKTPLPETTAAGLSSEEPLEGGLQPMSEHRLEPRRHETKEEVEKDAPVGHNDAFVEPGKARAKRGCHASVSEHEAGEEAKGRA